MKTVIVGSTNPVKIAAAQAAFHAAFPNESFSVQGASVASGVPNQPTSTAETVQGAWNRVEAARQAMPEADFWAAFEGGIEDVRGETHSFAWAVVQSRDGLRGKGSSGTFILPEAITALIHEGVELGDAADKVFERTNTKHTDGTVGILTHGASDRTDFYTHAMILALIPIQNPTLNPNHGN